MILNRISILNYKNIEQTDLTFSSKLNCFFGQNGMGKTNLLDAIYYLSFCKSAGNPIDSQNMLHTAEFFMIQGAYSTDDGRPEEIFCGMKRRQKKQFKRNKKEYHRLSDHIGLIPLVMISPSDQQLIDEGSDERRRFMDVVISQLDRKYLDCLTRYSALLKQRNALLKKIADEQPSSLDGKNEVGFDLLEVLEWQMVEPAEYIFHARTQFFENFQPHFESVYRRIAGSESQEIPENQEIPVLRYISQLQDRDLRDAYVRTRQRDLILGWTSQGIHKDDLEMRLGNYPLKQVGSQGQQRTFVLAMKLAQALYIGKPILLLDDIFDRLDSERVERIVEMVQGDEFGQIFITDTDREHLTEILKPSETAKIFHVENGVIQ